MQADFLILDVIQASVRHRGALRKKIMYALGHWRLKCMKDARRQSLAAAAKVQEFNSQDIANTLWAMTKMKFDLPEMGIGEMFDLLQYCSITCCALGCSSI